MPIPLPPGGNNLDFYADFFDQKFPGRNTGQAFLNYAAQHPGYTPDVLAQGFLTIIAIQGLDTALSTYLNAVATGTGQITQGIGAGLVSTFSVIPNLGTWFVRVAQIALGVVLIAVGVARLTRAVPVATQVAKTAGAVALA